MHFHCNLSWYKNIIIGADTTTGSPAPNTNPLPNPWAAGGGKLWYIEHVYDFIIIVSVHVYYSKLYVYIDKLDVSF